MTDIGFQIICRYNSGRLPGKILKEIEGKPILAYIVEKISAVVGKDSIVISTSQESSDDIIVEYCKKNGLKYFRGSLNNVSERFLKCAEEFNHTYTTRINGDNIFVDMESLSEMVAIAKTNKYDFVSNVKNRTFPKGMSIEIVKTKHYAEVYQQFAHPDDFEHVTIYLYQHDENKNYHYYFNHVCPEAAGLQMAIDTAQDFSIATKIISNFDGQHLNFGLKDVYKLYKQFNS